MKKQGIRFVIASGNQYGQIKSFFGNLEDEITFVSENGALIFDKGENISKVTVSSEAVREIIKVLSEDKDIYTCVCGVKSAYILKACNNPEAEKAMTFYYPNMKKCDSFDGIEKEDEIVHFSLFVPEERRYEIEEELKRKIGHLINPAISAVDCIDLNMNGCNKGSAIEKLCDIWNISLDECMAFGDSLNDFEMLKNVKYSYAMKNAEDRIKNIANYKTLSNDENGVLRTIKEYLHLNK